MVARREGLREVLLLLQQSKAKSPLSVKERRPVGWRWWSGYGRQVSRRTT